MRRKFIMEFVTEISVDLFAELAKWSGKLADEKFKISKRISTFLRT